MANLITAFNTLYISSALPSVVQARVQDDSAEFSLLCYGEPILEVTLFAYNNIIRFYDLRSVVEDAIFTYGEDYTGVFQISIQADNYIVLSPEFTVIYSAFKIQNYADFLNTHFLTTRQSFRIHRQKRQLLYWYKADNVNTDSHYIDCVVDSYSNEGEKKVLTIDQGSNQYSGMISTIVNPSDIQALLDSTFSSDSGRLLSFTVHRGSRSITFFVTDETPDFTLGFLDGFGCYVYADFHAITRRQLKADRSEASCLNHSVFYDDRSHFEYEVETSFLSSDEALWLEQLLSSRYVVFLHSYSRTDEILITSVETEISDSHEAKNKIKFTYKLSDRIPTFTPQSASQCFTPQFIDVFQ